MFDYVKSSFYLSLLKSLQNKKIDWRYQEAAVEIREEAHFHFEKMIMNFFSTIIATYGLLANNVPTIIGAMLISMLLGPITSTALALAEGDYPLLKKSIIIELVGVGLVLGTSFLIGKMHHEVSLESQVMDRTHPSIFDLAVALTCGFSVSIALISKKLSAGIIGVAISVSLTPPLAASGLLLSHGDYDLAFGAFLLFFTNFVGIEIAASTVFWLSGRKRIMNTKSEEVISLLLRNLISFISIVLLAVILSLSFQHELYKEIYISKVKHELEIGLSNFPHTELVDIKMEKKNKKLWIVATIDTPENLKKSDINSLEKKLPNYKNQKKPGLEIREIITTQIISK